VLASIREVETIRFVPTGSVVVGIFLSVACLAMLVYYIHDMSRAIEAPNVIQRSADDLADAIERLFPKSLGKETPENMLTKRSRTLPNSSAFKVTANQVGYL
jgi:uncharacterized membrane protein